MSGWSVMRVVYQQSGLMSGWSIMSVVCQQTGLMSGWSVSRVVSHKGFHGLRFVGDARVMFWSVCCSWSRFWATSKRRTVSALCVSPTASRLASCFTLTSSGWSWARMHWKQVGDASFTTTVTYYWSLFIVYCHCQLKWRTCGTQQKSDLYTGGANHKSCCFVEATNSFLLLWKKHKY